MPHDIAESFSQASVDLSDRRSTSDMLRLHSPLNAGLKRLFDIAASFSLIVLTLPVMLIVAALISLRDGLPVFYGHTRIGKDGETFTCWKFRTMVRDSQAQLQALLARDPEASAEWHETQKLKNDPRIIAGVGHFLRKSSLDELPQLWNVLIGEMSMVGPRPVVSEELKRYGAHVSVYKAVRPGLTGPWQIGNRSDDSYEKRVAKDVAYVRSWSLLTDLSIVLQTALVVVRRKGAY